MRDERDVNPPWERPSARVPVPPATAETAPSSGSAHERFQWGQAIEQSLPGTSIEDVTGTGKIAAIAPLQPGSSAWSSGVRAPRGRGAAAVQGDIELDEQPSVQMRAMRAGNLARATLIVTSALLLSRVLGLFRTSLFAFM